MKILLILFTAIAMSKPVIAQTEQDSPGAIMPFELKIVTYNHAQQSFDGQMCYRITPDSLQIYRYFMWQTAMSGELVEDTLIMETCHNVTALKELSRFKLDHLGNYYSNDEVMITSGNEISVKMIRNGVEKSVHLHAMKIPEIVQLFALVNMIVPEEYVLD
jgi:hypothetical protein